MSNNEKLETIHTKNILLLIFHKTGNFGKFKIGQKSLRQNDTAILTYANYGLLREQSEPLFLGLIRKHKKKTTQKSRKIAN